MSAVSLCVANWRVIRVYMQWIVLAPETNATRPDRTAENEGRQSLHHYQRNHHHHHHHLDYRQQNGSKSQQGPAPSAQRVDSAVRDSVELFLDSETHQNRSRPTRTTTADSYNTSSNADSQVVSGNHPAGYFDGPDRRPLTNGVDPHPVAASPWTAAVRRAALTNRQHAPVASLHRTSDELRPTRRIAVIQLSSRSPVDDRVVYHEPSNDKPTYLLTDSGRRPPPGDGHDVVATDRR